LELSFLRRLFGSVGQYPSIICECAAIQGQATAASSGSVEWTASMGGLSLGSFLEGLQDQHFTLCERLEDAASNVSTILYSAASRAEFMEATTAYRETLLKRQAFGEEPLDSLGFLLANNSLAYTRSVPLDVFLRLSTAVCYRYWGVIMSIIDSIGTNQAALLNQAEYSAQLNWQVVGFVASDLVALSQLIESAPLVADDLAAIQRLQELDDSAPAAAGGSGTGASQPDPAAAQKVAKSRAARRSYRSMLRNGATMAYSISSQFGAPPLLGQIYDAFFSFYSSLVSLWVSSTYALYFQACSFPVCVVTESASASSGWLDALGSTSGFASLLLVLIRFFYQKIATLRAIHKISHAHRHMHTASGIPSFNA
jgi:hypothetical protein